MLNGENVRGGAAPKRGSYCEVREGGGGTWWLPGSDRYMSLVSGRDCSCMDVGGAGGAICLGCSSCPRGKMSSRGLRRSIASLISLG